MRPIIALTGPDGVGKTTTAKAIQHEMRLLHPDMLAVVDSFAAPIHEALHELGFGAYRHGEWKEDTGTVGAYHSYRSAARALGSSLRSTMGQRVMIEAMASRHPGLASSACVLIVDDLRTRDEAEWVRRMGGVVVEITRAGVGYSGHPLDSRIEPDLTVVADDVHPYDLGMQILDAVSSVCGR